MIRGRRTCSPRRPTTGSRGYTPQVLQSWRASRDEVIAQRDAIAAWARLSYGWMGRKPRLQGGFPQHARRQCRVLYGKFADNARAWHKRGAGGSAPT